MKRRYIREIFGFFILFMTVSVVASVSVVIFNMISTKTDNNLVIALVTLVVILFLTTFCFVIDSFRRKYMMEMPLERILDATNKVTKGDFSPRLDIHHNVARYDEFDYIMLHLNIMFEELSKQEVINGDFIANFSHEIKTPISIIQNYATALKNSKLSESEINEYCDVLVDTSKKLSNLVSNILKLNKLENQNILPSLKKVDLAETIRGCVLGFIDAVDRKKIDLELQLDEISIETDEGLIELIVNNLVSNALKFTNDYLLISLKYDNNYVVIKVKDNGIGMSKEVGEHIFDKFYQGDISHYSDGNGLGLALVKKVIEILGGKVSVESEVGVGSTFIVRLRGDSDEK